MRSAPEKPFEKSFGAMIFKQGGCLLTPPVPVLAQIGDRFFQLRPLAVPFFFQHFQSDAERF